MSRLAEVLGNLLLAGVPLGDGEGQLDEALLVCLHLDAVDCQKDDGRCGAGSFIPIQERMGVEIDAVNEKVRAPGPPAADETPLRGPRQRLPSGRAY